MPKFNTIDIKYILKLNDELQNNERIFTFLCGYDSNIESILLALNIKEYDLPLVLEKRTPIGGKLVFEKWKDNSDGNEYISLSFVYQTLEQLRKNLLLDLINPPLKIHQ